MAKEAYLEVCTEQKRYTIYNYQATRVCVCVCRGS